MGYHVTTVSYFLANYGAERAGRSCPVDDDLAAVSFKLRSTRKGSVLVEGAAA